MFWRKKLNAWQKITLPFKTRLTSPVGKRMVRAEGRSGGTGSPCLEYGCPDLPFLHLCFPKSKCRSVSSVRRISNRPFVSTQHSTSLPNQHYQPPPSSAPTTCSLQAAVEAIWVSGNQKGRMVAPIKGRAPHPGQGLSRAKPCHAGTAAGGCAKILWSLAFGPWQTGVLLEKKEKLNKLKSWL